MHLTGVVSLIVAFQILATQLTKPFPTIGAVSDCLARSVVAWIMTAIL